MSASPIAAPHSILFFHEIACMFSVDNLFSCVMIFDFGCYKLSILCLKYFEIQGCDIKKYSFILRMLRSPLDMDFINGFAQRTLRFRRGRSFLLTKTFDTPHQGRAGPTVLLHLSDFHY